MSAHLVNEMMLRDDIDPLFHGVNLEEWVADRRNVALADGDNVALFEWTGKGAYKTHWFLAARGREALDLGNAALADMAKHYGALTIWGMTPVEWRHARWFNRKLGGRSMGTVETIHGECEIFVKEMGDGRQE